MATLLVQDATQLAIKHSDGNAFNSLNDTGNDILAGQVAFLAGTESRAAVAITDIKDGAVGAWELCVPSPIWQFKYGSAADCAVGERLAMDANGVLTVSVTGPWMGMPKSDTPGTAGGITAATGAAANGDSHILAARYHVDPGT